jgi:RNA polymerase sigma-70 factor (ECF subfamily)
MEDALAEEDSAYQLHVLLHELEEPYKEVFQLRVFGELSFRKIGQLFGKTENWARVTYHRARIKLQERMEQDESV